MNRPTPAWLSPLLPRSPGAWFDLGILAANLWLVPFLTGLSARSGETNPLYGAFLLAALFLYGAGAHGKRPHLAARLTMPAPPAPTWALITLFTLLIMQLALFMLGGFLAVSALKQIRILDPLLPGPESDLLLILIFVLAAVLVTLTVLALVPSPGRAVSPHPRPPGQERTADLFLYLAAVIFLSLWDGMVMADLAGRGPYPWYAAILLLVLITVPYAMFYLTPRLLVLVEDYRRPGTWLRLCLVMLPLSLRLLA